MSKWYGSIDNRIAENRMFCDEIKVGTLMTEFSWSDRHPYEVVEVKDQKHVTVRAMDHRLVGEAYSNNWELISNPENPLRELVKRGTVWYYTTTVTADMVDRNNIDDMLWLCHLGIGIDELEAKKKITRRRKANVSFGIGEYYYDYEF